MITRFLAARRTAYRPQVQARQDALRNEKLAASGLSHPQRRSLLRRAGAWLLAPACIAGGTALVLDMLTMPATAAQNRHFPDNTQLVQDPRARPQPDGLAVERGIGKLAEADPEPGQPHRSAHRRPRQELRGRLCHGHDGHDHDRLDPERRGIPGTAQAARPLIRPHHRAGRLWPPASCCRHRPRFPPFQAPDISG